MSYWILAFQLFSAICALASGVFWLKSARVKIAWGGIATLSGPAKATIIQLNRQSGLNRWAALAAGWCAFCQAIALLLQAWAQGYRPF